MNKKQIVKTLIELLSTLKNVPTKDDGHSIDMDKFLQIDRVKAVLILLKELNVDYDYLCKAGFIPAALLLGKYIGMSKHEILNA